MNNPIAVTFDHNTYEYVVSPDKEASQLSLEDRNVYKELNEYIKRGYILPFLSETILTIETLSKVDRKKILSRTDRIISEISDEKYLKDGITSKVRLIPNSKLYPEKTDHFYKYLPKAIELGFKILPSYRLGKLINPAVNSNWYYIFKTEDPFEVLNRFSSIVSFIEEEGFGFTILKKLIAFDDELKQPWIYFLKKYNGKLDKLKEGIAEWSDADSIAIHIAFGFKYFCTMDGSGKKNKSGSVFGNEMKLKLKNKYQVEFVTPEELVDFIAD